DDVLLLRGIGGAAVQFGWAVAVRAEEQAPFRVGDGDLGRVLALAAGEVRPGEGGAARPAAPLAAQERDEGVAVEAGGRRDAGQVEEGRHDIRRLYGHGDAAAA